MPAKAFEKIGSQQQNETANYEFLDRTASMGAGNLFYRLKMIDLDGKYNFSKIISIESKGEKSLVGNFYPNPSTGKAHIEVNATENGAWDITIYDIIGKVISVKTKILQKGMNIISIENLNQGLNFVRFEHGTVSEIRKVIKE